MQLLVAIGSTLVTMGLTVYNHELKQSTGSTRIRIWIGISIVLKGPNNANARNIWRLMRASVSGNLCCANASFLNANAHSCGRECAHLLLARYSALARIRHWANASICYASAPEANTGECAHSRGTSACPVLYIAYSSPLLSNSWCYFQPRCTLACYNRSQTRMAGAIASFSWNVYTMIDSLQFFASPM